MQRPNILFLLSDEHSFRFMGHVPESEGGEPIGTPTFDYLAAHGTRFSDTYCQMPLCTPSRLCLLTGREVRAAGAWNNCDVLRPELPTLPGVLRDGGYTTSLVGKMHLGGRNQGGGFQYRPYGDLTGGAGHQREPLIRPADMMAMRLRTTGAGVSDIPEPLLQEEMIARASVSFLREQRHANPEKPWFLCASFSRPHFPLTCPKRHFDRFWPEGVTEPKVPATGDAWDHPMSVGMREGFMADAVERDEMMRARAAYFGCVTYLDELLGDFLAVLDRDGFLDNTVIVYTSDHGEMAGEHGVWWKNSWHEASARVPLIVSTPEQRKCDDAGNVCRNPVSLADLFPTLASLAGVDSPSNLDGVDLTDAITPGGEAPDRPVFCDALTPRWGEGTEFRMIRKGNYKYIRFRDAEPLAFDLVEDPGEQLNLLTRTNAPKVQAALDDLAQLAESSMDFDEAERERVERDGHLGEEYSLNLPPSTGNLFQMPDGRIISADDLLYHPRVVADSMDAAYGNGWDITNGLG